PAASRQQTVYRPVLLRGAELQPFRLCGDSRCHRGTERALLAISHTYHPLQSEMSPMAGETVNQLRPLRASFWQMLTTSPCLVDRDYGRGNVLTTITATLAIAVPLHILWI